jgi:hypothetical protein
MRLQRQGLVGGEHLQQERQRVAEAPANGRAELTLGIVAQRVEQRHLALVGLQPRRITRMRTEPQFRLGMRCGRRPSGEVGNRGPRTPCIGPHRSA